LVNLMANLFSSREYNYLPYANI